ncbi:MAG TPA: LysR family transcriptional regulator [Candidatus Caenarcaniphilales bacterium]
MDKLKGLTIFVRTAQYRSFSEAARQLGMSPSAVSRAVLRLEDDLGIRLLQRTTRSLTLTEDGHRFYERCQQIINDLEEAELEVKRSQSTPTGTLRLDLTFAFGKMHIAPALQHFAAHYPELQLNVSFNDRLIDLIDEGIDATVRIGTSSDSRLIMQSLAMERLVTCVSPKYLAQYGVPTIPTELVHHRCVNFIYPQTRRECEWKFEQDGNQFGYCVNSYLQFDNAEVVLEAAIQGTGIVQLPKFMVASAIARGELKPILVSHTAQAGLPIAVIYPQKRYLSGKVRAFIKFMAELMTALKRAGFVD